MWSQMVIPMEAGMHSRIPPTHWVTLNGSKRERRVSGVTLLTLGHM